MSFLPCAHRTSALPRPLAIESPATTTRTAVALDGTGEGGAPGVGGAAGGGGAPGTGPPPTSPSECFGAAVEVVVPALAMAPEGAELVDRPRAATAVVAGAAFTAVACWVGVADAPTAAVLVSPGTGGGGGGGGAPAPAATSADAPPAPGATD